jgi:hypothetical protein
MRSGTERKRPRDSGEADWGSEQTSAGFEISAYRCLLGFSHRAQSDPIYPYDKIP